MKVSEQEYIEALKKYYHETVRFIHVTTSKDLSPQINAIQHFESQKAEAGFSSPLFHLVSSVLLAVATSILMAVLLVWATREVFGLAVDFSFKNIIILSGLFIVGKSKARFGTQDNRKSGWINGAIRNRF